MVVVVVFGRGQEKEEKMQLLVNLWSEGGEEDEKHQEEREEKFMLFPI